VLPERALLPLRPAWRGCDALRPAIGFGFRDSHRGTLRAPTDQPGRATIAIFAVGRVLLKKLLSSDMPIDMSINVSEIVSWAQKINDLLSIHTITIDKDSLISCVLRNIDDNNKVQVVTLSPQPPA
jgi:hypothetical protein